MTVSAMLFLAAPRGLAALFTRDAAVIATSIALLRVAAAFQLFDGIQGVTTGVLRGLGDTRTPMLANVVGHWLIGLPVAAFIAFDLGWGVIGLWAGLSISLTLVGVVLIGVWRRRLVELQRAARRAGRHEADASRRDAMTSDRLFTPRFFWMCAFTFTVFLSLFQLIPTAPFHVRDLGGGSLASGLFLGFLTFASAWSAPFTGAFADRNGRRRTLIVASLWLAGFTAIYSVIHNYPRAAGARAAARHRLVVAAVGIGGLPDRRSATGAPRRRHRVLGDLERARRRRRAVGRLLAVLARMDLSLRGHDAPQPDDGSDCVVHGGRSGRSLRADMRSRSGLIEWRVVALSAPLFLYSYSYGTVSSFSAVFADARGMHPKSIYLTTFAVTTLLTRPFLGRYGDRIGYRRIFLPSLVMMTFGMIALTFFGQPSGAGGLRVDVCAWLRDGVPGVCRLRDAGRRPRAPRRGVRRDPRGVRHRHRRRIDDERMADRALQISGRVRPGRGALGPRASRLSPQRAPVRTPGRDDDAAAARSSWS